MHWFIVPIISFFFFQTRIQSPLGMEEPQLFEPFIQPLLGCTERKKKKIDLKEDKASQS